MLSEKGLQDEKLSQSGAASRLVGAIQRGFTGHKGNQTLGKGKLMARRAWKRWIRSWSQ